MTAEAAADIPSNKVQWFKEASAERPLLEDTSMGGSVVLFPSLFRGRSITRSDRFCVFLQEEIMEVGGCVFESQGGADM